MMLITSRKKPVGDRSGKTMSQKRRPGPAPSIAAASISDLRDRLQAGEEEQEIVADLAPHGGEHDQQQRLVAVDHSS